MEDAFGEERYFSTTDLDYGFADERYFAINTATGEAMSMKDRMAQVQAQRDALIAQGYSSAAVKKMSPRDLEASVRISVPYFTKQSQDYINEEARVLGEELYGKGNGKLTPEEIEARKAKAQARAKGRKIVQSNTKTRKTPGGVAYQIAGENAGKIADLQQKAAAGDARAAKLLEEQGNKLKSSSEELAKLKKYGKWGAIAGGTALLGTGALAYNANRKRNK